MKDIEDHFEKRWNMRVTISTC